MTTLADIVRQYAPAYRAAYAEQMLPSHHAALNAIARCRTAALGGHVYACDACGTVAYRYHSCRNRHCPTCQHGATDSWLAQQRDLLLPVPHFLVTFTIPSALREVARQHQRLFYTLLFRTSAAALQQLAHDPRHLGGQIGMLGVLQTWTRDLRYHPHIHYLVPGVGLAADGRAVLLPSASFLVPVKALAVLFRAKLRAALAQTPLRTTIPLEVWQQEWVVDCRAVGNGQTALKYLAPYVFRVALSNNRIVRLEHDHVTFRYTDSATRQSRLCRLPVLEFLHRFLQHVLPAGFVKVRYYGFFRHGKRAVVRQLRQQLLLAQRVSAVTDKQAVAPHRTPDVPVACPNCGRAMRLRQHLSAHSRGPPLVDGTHRKCGYAERHALVRPFGCAPACSGDCRPATHGSSVHSKQRFVCSTRRFLMRQRSDW